MKRSLEKATSNSFSFDLWICPTDCSFLALIGHWITEEFEYNEQVLGLVQVVNQRTGENLAQLLFQCLEDYQCTRKLLSLTCDNASNNNSC